MSQATDKQINYITKLINEAHNSKDEKAQQFAPYINIDTESLTKNEASEVIEVLISFNGVGGFHVITRGDDAVKNAEILGLTEIVNQALNLHGGRKELFFALRDGWKLSEMQVEEETEEATIGHWYSQLCEQYSGENPINELHRFDYQKEITNIMQFAYITNWAIKEQNLGILFDLVKLPAKNTWSNSLVASLAIDVYQSLSSESGSKQPSDGNEIMWAWINLIAQYGTEAQCGFTTNAIKNEVLPRTYMLQTKNTLYERGFDNLAKKFGAIYETNYNAFFGVTL